MSPIIQLCEKKSIDYFIIHSNQHYSASMDEIFFDELNLPSPKYNLNVGSGKHSNQTGNILIKMEPILEEEKPDYVLVQGDTNTVLAGGLAAAKLDIKVGHVEAGLRSYDRKMPEETNRVVTDHLSSFLFAVTNNQEEILKAESVEPFSIHVVGNTVVDAALDNISIAEKKSDILKKHNLKSKEYILLTAHRSSNVDFKDAYAELLDVVTQVTANETVIWPIHPRAQKKLSEFELTLPSNVTLIDPIGYLDFLVLQKNAKIALSDSGGVQEECCILRTPCITLRENTERPETVDVGANILVGRDVNKAKIAYKKLLEINTNWENPFGDGTTSEQIINILNADYFGLPISQSVRNEICVIGLGYMGLPMACLLSNAGNHVTGVDINDTKVKDINNGNCPFDEAGMQDVLTTALNSKFTAQSSPVKADTFIISVPTPEKNNKCDLTYVKKACEGIVPYLEDGNLVIIESTIKPGSCLLMMDEVFSHSDKKVLIAHCPERAIPGNTIHELIYNDRLVGGLCEESTNKAYEIYKSFSKGNIFKTNATTAECCKLMENTFRDVNIALANEMDVILKEYGVNPWEAIELANKHPRVNILSPGPGVGGHCIAIDPWFLTEDSDKGKMIHLAREINNSRPHYYVNEILALAKEKNLSKIAILGVAYKKNVDDARETPAKYIFEGIESNGLEVRASDPYVQTWKYDIHETNEVVNWAHIIIIVTDHDDYNKINFKNKLVIDTRNILKLEI
jgi:UDP-N-acetylglucosamine 2-epimerase (non-hydrolysing)